MTSDDSDPLDTRGRGPRESLVNGYRSWCLLPGAAAMESPEGVAWEGTHEIIERDPDEAVSVLTAVAKSFGPEEVRALCQLGADALEDLINVDPPKYLERFEQAAIGDERIAIAMSAVWMREPWHSRLVDLRRRTRQPLGGW